VLSVRRHELFGETKVNDENSVSVFASASSEVVRLDISMDNPSRVDILDTFDDLLSNHKDSFN